MKIKKKTIFLFILLAFMIVLNIGYADNEEVLSGWQTIDGFTYYYRVTDNDGSPGAAGTMVVGFARINDKIYYFREIPDQEKTGPKGSLLTDDCFGFGNMSYCTNANGELISELQVVEAPTTDMCADVTYTGKSQSLTKPAQLGYTWNNNMKTDAGTQTISAELTPGYAWLDGTTLPKEITCQMKKKVIPVPYLAQIEYDYTGKVIDPIVVDYDENLMWMTGEIAATEAGYYQFNLEIKGAASKNVEWPEGTSNVLLFDWQVNKLDLPAPSVISYTGEYDGKPHTLSVVPPTYGVVQYSIDGQIWGQEKPTRTELGTSVVYVRVPGDHNHNASPVITGRITITSISNYIIRDLDVDYQNNYIKNININTTADDIRNKFVLLDGYSLEIDYKNGTTPGKKLVYTGGKIKIMQGPVVYKEFAIVVSGDTNGDGELNYLDYVKVYNHIQKTKNPNSNKTLLTGVYLAAADMSHDNTVNYLDYVKIYNKIKELKGGK